MKNKEDVGSLCWWQRLSVDGVWQESQVLKSYEIVWTDYGNIALSWHISSEPSSLKGQENWSWNSVAGCLIKRPNIQILNCSKKVGEWLQLFSSIGSICGRKKIIKCSETKAMHLTQLICADWCEWPLSVSRCTAGVSERECAKIIRDRCQLRQCQGEEMGRNIGSKIARVKKKKKQKRTLPTRREPTFCSGIPLTHCHLGLKQLLQRVKEDSWKYSSRLESWQHLFFVVTEQRLPARIAMFHRLKVLTWLYLVSSWRAIWWHTCPDSFVSATIPTFT